MRIAFFSKQLPHDSPNGVSWQVHRLANALVDKGHDVTCFAGGRTPLQATYRHVELSMNHSNPIIKKFLPAIRFSNVNKKDFDILHFHGDDYLIGGASNRVRTFYGSALFEAVYATSLARSLYQFVFYAFEWISCLKKGTLVGISSITCKALPRIKHIIPCAIEKQMYCGNPQKSEYPTILTIGELYGRKRTKDVITSFVTTVVPLFPEAKLALVGPDKFDHPAIQCYSVLEQKTLLGLFAQSWIYCSASTYEGFGVPYVEAMAMQALVVSVESRGVTQIVEHMRTGVVCKRSALGQTLAGCVSLYKNYDGIRANGLEKVVEYSSSVVADKYEAMYKNICKK